VERHPDLVLIGRAVILRPIRHLMCGYFVDRTSVPHMSRPFWFANLAYLETLCSGVEGGKTLDIVAVSVRALGLRWCGARSVQAFIPEAIRGLH
jgi:hypothetical protein